MQSNISKELDMKFPPIVLLKSDEKPEAAIGPRGSKGGCIMSFVAQTIAKRVTTCFGRENITCGGINVGFGWGSEWQTKMQLTFRPRSCHWDLILLRTVIPMRKG